MISKDMHGRILVSGNEKTDIKVPVTLSWDQDEDPYAIQMIVELEEDVVWVFSRELLWKGLSRVMPVGTGDVRIKYQSLPEPRIVICLKSPGGHADLALPHRPVANFVAETLRYVVIGEETIDGQIDEFLKELFAA